MVLRFVDRLINSAKLSRDQASKGSPDASKQRWRPARISLPSAYAARNAFHATSPSALCASSAR